MRSDRSLHRLAVAPILDEHRHLQSLRMMRNHALHERHVGVRDLDARQIGGVIGRNRPAGLARGTRLNDGRLGAAVDDGQRGQRHATAITMRAAAWDNEGFTYVIWASPGKILDPGSSVLLFSV